MFVAESQDLDLETMVLSSEGNPKKAIKVYVVFIAPACSRVRYRRPIFRPSVRPSVRLSVRPSVNIYVEVRHLCQS